VKSKLMQLVLTLAVLNAGPVLAGDYTARQIGDTPLTLGNSAPHTKHQYFGGDAATLRRFHDLLCDVEALRDALGQLPPELERHGSPVVTRTVHADLQLLFGEALRHNPELLPLRTSLAGLAAQTRQAGAQNDPMAMLEFSDIPATPPIFGGLRESAVSVGISQEYSSYGKRGMKQDIASFDERLKLDELADRELKLCWDIVQKYYDIAGNVASLRAMDRDIQLMGIVVEFGNERYGLGLTPQAKVLEAQLKLSLLEKQRVEMRTMVAQQKEELLEMLGHPADFDISEVAFSFPYPQPDGLKLEQSALLAQTLDVLPEYQHALLAEQQKSLNTELARRELHPDYTLSAGYMVKHGMEDSFTASIAVPLLTHKEDRQDAAVQQAYAEQLTAQDEEAVIPNRLQRELANLQSELDMHGDNVEHYRTIIVPQARLTAESMLQGYAAGTIDLDEVVMALQTALDAENDYEQQRIHYVHVLSDLQVLTAGVFDPAPHMAHGAEPPPAGQPIGDSVGGLVIPNPPDAPAGAADSRPSAGGAGPDAPFIDSLALPDIAPPAAAGTPGKDQAGGSKGQPAGKAPAKDAAKAKAAADGAGSGADQDFYKPFEPKDGGKT
jgi:cobalt-zinc-cadmium efflux system outer membrane protein